MQKKYHKYANRGAEDRGEKLQKELYAIKLFAIQIAKIAHESPGYGGEREVYKSFCSI